LGAREPVGVGEAGEDGVLALNTSIVCIAVCADNVARFADAEEVGEAEVGALVEVFVVEARLKTGHNRSAGLNIVMDLLALAVAQHGNIGQ
jgi:hypothetical protein